MTDPNKAMKYDIILSDPPWAYYGQQEKWGAAAKFYETTPDERIAEVADPRPYMANKSIVFMWATSPRLDFALKMFDQWGLHYRGVAFVWVKSKKDGTPIGARGVRPSIVKPTCEFVLAGSTCPKGRPLPLSSESIRQVVLAPTREHSRKPEEVPTRIVEMYPTARRLEMFARELRPGWDSHGKEVTKFCSDDSERSTQ